MMMEGVEWERVFGSLPDGEGAAFDEFVERKRRLMERELREFDEKWEGRTVNGGGSGEQCKVDLAVGGHEK